MVEAYAYPYRPILQQQPYQQQLWRKDERPQAAVPRLPPLHGAVNREQGGILVGLASTERGGVRQQQRASFEQGSGYPLGLSMPLTDRPSDHRQEGPETLDEVGKAISSALFSLRERVQGDTQGIRDVQGTLMKRIGLLKKRLKEAQLERDAETEHSRRLSDAFAREMENTESHRRELEESKKRQEELEQQLRDLQTRYFRSTELASISAVPADEYVEVLKGENEKLHEELRRLRQSTEKDEQIQRLQCDLDLQKPLVEQLRRDLTESYMRHKELSRQLQQLTAENEELRNIRRPLSDARSSGMISVDQGNDSESSQRFPAEFDLEEHVRVNIDVLAGGGDDRDRRSR